MTERSNLFRALYRRLREWTSRDDTPFARSVLDRSVDEAHGGGASEGTRELERTQSEAADLAEAQREH